MTGRRGDQYRGGGGPGRRHGGGGRGGVDDQVLAERQQAGIPDSRRPHPAGDDGLLRVILPAAQEEQLPPVPSDVSPPGWEEAREWAIRARRGAGRRPGDEALPLPAAHASALRETSVERAFEGRPGRASHVPEGVIN